LDTKYRQLARAPRADWDRIMHDPIHQIEKVDKAGGLNDKGEPIVNENFVKTHCDDIVEGIRVHERAHRDFFYSPGNVVDVPMRSRHLRLRSESEVVSYRIQKAFLKEKLDAAKISADAEGHYRGSATVNWAGTLIGSLAWGSTMNYAPTRADLNGEMDDNGPNLMNLEEQVRY
jgi:hypothetical protein